LEQTQSIVILCQRGKGDEWQRNGEDYINEQLHYSFAQHNILGVIKSRTSLTGHVVCMKETRKYTKFGSEKKGRTGGGLECNIKTDLGETGFSRSDLF